MYRGVLPVRAIVRGPVRSRIHFFWEIPVRGRVWLALMSFLRRTPQAVRLQVHASASTL